MNYTLLEVVQLILSAMDSDDVSAITDTDEAYQVALLLKQVFYDTAVEIGLPQQEKLVELTASGDNAKPTLMTVPSTVARISWIKYDNKADADTYKDYQEVKFMPFEEFLEMQNALREQTSDVGQMNITSNSETFEVMYRSDKMPQWYTTLEENQIIFDSYDVSIDATTLAKAKSMCMAWVLPTFTLSDAFAIPLEPQQFPYYINKAKVRAFSELKQVANQEAAGEARQQKILMQKRKFVLPTVAAIETAPRYGRR